MAPQLGLDAAEPRGDVAFARAEDVGAFAMAATVEVQQQQRAVDGTERGHRALQQFEAFARFHVDVERAGDAVVRRVVEWLVPSIAEARVRAAGLGGEVWPVDREWEATSRGFRACDGRDPEGNVFQVREPL